MNTAAHRNLKEIERLQRAEATLMKEYASLPSSGTGVLHAAINKQLKDCRQQLAARMARITDAL
jgi:hypothetical protein